jgi:hypothetical protein
MTTNFIETLMAKEKTLNAKIDEQDGFYKSIHRSLNESLQNFERRLCRIFVNHFPNCPSCIKGSSEKTHGSTIKLIADQFPCSECFSNHRLQNVTVGRNHSCESRCYHCSNYYFNFSD